MQKRIQAIVDELRDLLFNKFPFTKCDKANDLLDEILEEVNSPEKTGLFDCNGKELCVGDIVSLYRVEGKVVKCHGAYGIGFNDLIPWEALHYTIFAETGCNSPPHFCENDNFISFWELAWNYNCEEDYYSMVRKIDNDKEK